MNHFGIAFGTIVVGVLVGAVAFDHAIKDKPAAVASTTPTKAETSPPPEKVVVAENTTTAAPPAQEQPDIATKGSSKSAANSIKSKPSMQAPTAKPRQAEAPAVDSPVTSPGTVSDVPPAPPAANPPADSTPTPPPTPTPEGSGSDTTK